MKDINLKFYKILRELGKGGMATVYLAEHRMLQNKVAIKVLNKEFLNNSNIKNRFISEARKLAQLDHPNIVRVVDLLDNEDQVAFVMEYLEGESLKDTLQQKKLNDDVIEGILKQMTSALAYVHEEGLIHRDIKPSNFIFDKKGSLKLTDFGISKDTSAQNSEYTQTATHINMGTPMYMSPEQIRSLKDVTKLTDIYSLGVVLWEMVSGKKPYNTQTLSSFDLQLKIVNESLPITNTKWDGVIQKATKKSKQDRLYNLKYFLYPEQIEIEENYDDEKTVIYSKKQKEPEKKKRSKNSKERKKKKRGFVYFLILMIVFLIAGLILRPYLMKQESASDKIINVSSQDSKIKEKTSIDSSEENKTIVKAEKPIDKSDFKYRSKIKKSSDYKYLSNLSHEGKITEFLKAEDEENWEVITYLFSGKAEKHWNNKEPTYKSLYTTYHNNWKKTFYKKNEVKSINKLNNDEYKVEVTYYYTEASDGERKKVDNTLYFKFDNGGEIVAVDEFSINNIRTLTEEEIKGHASFIDTKYPTDIANYYIVRANKKEEFGINHYSDWVKRDNKRLTLRVNRGNDFVLNDGYIIDSSEENHGIFHLFKNYYKTINTYLIYSGKWETGWSWYDYVNKVTGDHIQVSSEPIISPNNKKIITYYNGGHYDYDSYFKVYSIVDNKYKEEKISEHIDYSFITDIKWIGNNKIEIENSEITSEGGPFKFKNKIIIEFKGTLWTKVK